MSSLVALLIVGFVVCWLISLSSPDPGSICVPGSVAQAASAMWAVLVASDRSKDKRGRNVTRYVHG